MRSAKDLLNLFQSNIAVRRPLLETDQRLDRRSSRGPTVMPCSAASSWVSSRGNPYVSYSSKAAGPLTDAAPDPFLCADAFWSTASNLFWPAFPGKVIVRDVKYASRFGI